ncbi:jupiter microtubule associated homolog 2 [Synchiropus picturatus]
MTSTNMFQGLDTGSKPSSRVLRPPGGGASNVFGGYEDDSASPRRSNKMASKVFAPPEEPQNTPRRSNPPGGKTSGIFGEPEIPAQPQRPVPPGGATSNIFGPAESAAVQSPNRSHPNKPKDNLTVGAEPESPAPVVKVVQPVVEAEPSPPAVAAAKEEPAPVPQPQTQSTSSSSSSSSSPSSPDDNLKKHEPHLGPKPRSHNRVLNPPGGKSSVVFY